MPRSGVIGTSNAPHCDLEGPCDVNAVASPEARTNPCDSMSSFPFRSVLVHANLGPTWGTSRSFSAVTAQFRTFNDRVMGWLPASGRSILGRPKHVIRARKLRYTRPRSRGGRVSEYAVDLGGHDEVVLMQSIDLLGLQRDRRMAPTEADIRMMAFSFREFTNLLNKGKRLSEVAKPEAPLDAVSFLRQLPVWACA